MRDLVLHFDFGYSYQNNVAVRETIFDRLPATVSLAIGAAVVWLLIGIPIGIISAIKRGTLLDRAAMGFALLAISAPVYWVGLVSIYLFSEDLGKLAPIFKGSGQYTPFTEDPIAWASALILPWLVLATAFAAIYARFLRANLLDVMGEDYIRTARAKGLGERRVVFKHGLRSAITPIVTIFGLDLGILFGGAILTETVFNIPGHRPPRVRRDPEERPADRAGHRADRGGRRHPHEPDRGHPVRIPRPARALLVADMALLEIENLQVHFDTDDGVVKAVDGISYTVDRGQTLGIVGESGSGKSVSSLTVMGLSRARNARISGSIKFDGKELLTASDDELRTIRGNDIAMIFQDPLSSLHPFYKVGAQIVEAIRAHRDVSKQQAYDRAVEMLGLVGIPEPRKRAESYPHEFSGGMRQRAMIAMALANDPKLLIADEPTTALDVTVQAQILELIERLQSEFDTAVVVITHDLGVVAEMADEIAVMYAGRIVEHADTDTIFAGPEHPYTWGLLSSIPRLDSPRDEELVPIAGPPAVADQPARRLLVPPALPVRQARPHEDRPEARADARTTRATGSRACSSPRRAASSGRELREGKSPVDARADVMHDVAAGGLGGRRRPATPARARRRRRRGPTEDTGA